MPDKADYDYITATWMIEYVFTAYGDCAIRKQKLVDSWPKNETH